MSDSLKNKIKYFLIATLVLGGCALAYGIQNGQNGNKFETYTVQSVPLGQTVEATGSLEPATAIDLSFQKSGEVSRVIVDVGQRVKKGDLLASLVNTNETSSLAQSRGVLAEARASLNLKLANATDADIAIARADVQQALANKQKSDVDYSNSMTDLNNTKKIVEQDIKTAELDLEGARLNLQKTQSTTSTSTTQNSSSVENSSSALKSAIDQLLVSTKNVLQVLDRMYGIKDTSFQSFKSTLADGGSFDFMYAKELYQKNLQSYDDLKKIVDSFPPIPPVEELQSTAANTNDLIRNMNEDITDSTLLLDKVSQGSATLPQLKTDLNTASNSFNTISSSYKTAKQVFDTALIGQQGSTVVTPLDIQTSQLLVDQKTQNLSKVRVDAETKILDKETAMKTAQALVKVAGSAVDRANAEMDKVLAKPRTVDVAPYRARVQQAQAQVDRAQSDYDNTLALAPFDGIITAKNIDQGEQFSIASGIANKPALSIIDDSKFHIDVNIPETQVTKISAASKVVLTFDALGSSEEFEGKILSIEPSSTNVQGIIYYKTKIALVHPDIRLKAGMTVNVSIASDSISNMLSIPEKALSLDSQNNKTVLIAPDKSVQVRTGVRGKNGLIEVTSGLKEGDTILVPVK